jgi:hypothetical protein
LAAVNSSYDIGNQREINIETVSPAYRAAREKSLREEDAVSDRPSITRGQYYAVPSGVDRCACGVGIAAGGWPALLILAPLLLPIATQLGISDLHYGIVLLIAMGIGAFLPPLGVGFYIACAIGRAPMGASTRAMVPYVAVLLVGLLLVTFVPWFTLALPRAVGLAP